MKVNDFNKLISTMCLVTVTSDCGNHYAVVIPNGSVPEFTFLRTEKDIHKSLVDTVTASFIVDFLIKEPSTWFPDNLRKQLPVVNYFRPTAYSHTDIDLLKLQG